MRGEDGKVPLDAPGIERLAQKSWGGWSAEQRAALCKAAGWGPYEESALERMAEE